jgi:hypothetical protein
MSHQDILMEYPSILCAIAGKLALDTHLLKALRLDFGVTCHPLYTEGNKQIVLRILEGNRFVALSLIARSLKAANYEVRFASIWNGLAVQALSLLGADHV